MTKNKFNPAFSRCKSIFGRQGINGLSNGSSPSLVSNIKRISVSQLISILPEINRKP